MAKVVLMFRNKVIKEVAVGPQGIKIGRESDNDIQIDNVAVSRYHAEIYRQGYPFYLEDMKSTNGTILNGAVLGWKGPLSHNDKILIGKHTLVFIEEAKDSLDKKPKQDAGATLCLSPADLARLRENR